MTTRGMLLTIASALLMLSVSAGPVRATPATSMDASTILQGIVPDSEVFLLSEFAGFSVGSLNYNASSMAGAWNATLAGTYRGTALNVSYNGDLSDFPTGPLTWTSSGFYGAAVWAGSGNARFTLLPMGDFQIAVVSSLILGSDVGTYAITILGNETGDDIDVFDDLQTGTITTNGISLVGERFAKLSYKRKDFTEIQTDVKIRGHEIIVDSIKLAGTQTGFNATGTVSTIAEPSTFTLFGAGVFGLLGADKWRKRKRPKGVRAFRNRDAVAGVGSFDAVQHASPSCSTIDFL
jgi:hypothetical protein